MVRIADHLRAQRHTGTAITRRTVTRLLAQLGLNRRRFIDLDGDTNRAPRVIVAERPGHVVHVDVKKVGHIPDGGGWRAHGRDSDRARAAKRAKTRSATAAEGGPPRAGRRGYVYLHPAVDGHTRMAYAEALPDERAVTAIGFVHRARVWLATHGITHIEKIVTDNGACYRADAFTRALLAAKHKRTKPYTPSTMGKSSDTTGSSPEAVAPEQGPAVDLPASMDRLRNRRRSRVIMGAPGSGRSTRWPHQCPQSGRPGPSWKGRIG